MNADTPEMVADLALADCASEPIRIPGAIQPHGHLLAFETRTLVVQHASANVATLVGRDLGEILGRPLTDWLDAVDATTVLAALEVDELPDSDAPVVLNLRGQPFEGTLHRNSGLSILELEPCAAPAVESVPVLARVLRRLQDAAGLTALLEASVREVRQLTGCDRVVVYAFSPDGHGSVLAEARADDMTPYLGLHFPASDIPAQARELYKQNWLRMIPDVDYEPVPILGLQTAVAEAPLDLTFALLRSVSPVHREYMRHMDTASSMSISLMRDGELWGLISCGHRKPRHLSRDVRSACLSIGRLLSLQISALEGVRESKLIHANQRLLAPLVEAMQHSTPGVLQGLAAAPEALLALTAAMGAAVVIGDQITLIGHCPTQAQVVELSKWAFEHAALAGIFCAADLPFGYPPAEAFAQTASGILAITLPKPGNSMVLWFRPEAAHIVTWAGDPNKTPSLDKATGTLRLSPRHSFEAWKTLLHHRSEDWGMHQLDAARELRRSAVEIDLAAQVVREREAVAARDELMAVVSHDLRSPMSVVVLQALVLNRTLATETSAASRRMLAAVQSIQHATGRMTSMLTDLLDTAAMKEGRYSVEMMPVEVESLFEDARALLTPIAEAKHVALTFDGEPGLLVDADSERIYQVIANLVGNALKFTDEGGQVRVSARRYPDQQGRLARFVIADTGCGMRPDQLTHIFERYWKARESSRAGTGLGLYIAKGIVQAHGGTISAQSTLGVGSAFEFTLAAVQPGGGGIATSATGNN